MRKDKLVKEVEYNEVAEVVKVEEQKDDGD